MKTESNLTKKFRPHKFSDVVGQDISVKKLEGAIRKGVMPPAYLFSGTTGCGKTTCARILAMALNCSNRQDIEPCGECKSCRAMMNDTSEYLIEVDGATCGKVEDTRNLMASLHYVVPADAYKVVIIDECHGLTKQAWDASLKTIEEPPPRTLFVFCTTEVAKVIPTIKNRCTVIQFPGVADQLILETLKKIIEIEKVPCEDKALVSIVKSAEGSIRDAQNKLEGFIRLGKVTEDDVNATYQSLDSHTLMAYFNHISNQDERGASAVASGWIRMGVTPQVVVTDMLEHVRNMIWDWAISDGTLRQVVKLQKEKVGAIKIVQWIDFLYDQLKYIKDYPMSYQLVMDLITIKLIDTLKSPVKKKKEDKAEAQAAPAEHVLNEPVPAPEAQKVDPELSAKYEQAVNQMKLACGGIVQRKTDTYTTMTGNRGTVFDVVLAPQFAVTQYYFLYSDVDKAVAGYPANMSKFLKLKQ